VCRLRGRIMAKMVSKEGSLVARRRKGFPFVLVASYVSDWLAIIGLGIAGLFMGNVTPNKRPFSLTDRDISYAIDASSRIST
jgi:hypothetical protein